MASTRHDKAAVQERLRRAAGRAAQLGHVLAGLQRQLRPAEGLVHFEVSPRDGVRRQLRAAEAAGPAARRPFGPVQAEPPLVRLDDHAVQHQRSRRDPGLQRLVRSGLADGLGDGRVFGDDARLVVALAGLGGVAMPDVQPAEGPVACELPESQGVGSLFRGFR
jgi:hypothetical protein